VKRRIIQKLLRLYPSLWRDEYGTELEDLLLAEPLQPAVVLNVIANALRHQVRFSWDRKVPCSIHLREISIGPNTCD